MFYYFYKVYFGDFATHIVVTGSLPSHLKDRKGKHKLV